MRETPLQAYLVDLLRRSGPIPFERYMALCLYHPEHGYYTRGEERTGVRGDYFTSSDLHPIFARLVARQAEEMWRALERPGRFVWVEMGAGRGLFARDFLRFASGALPDFFAALDYVAIESSPAGRARLAARLAEAGLESRARVLSTLEELDPATGCFFSNELVDAFPVAVVTRREGHLKEIYIALEDGKLREQTGPFTDSAVAAAVARYANQLEEGHRVEVNRKALEWVRRLAEKLARGFVLTIDYGDLADRLFTPGRPRGTLAAYHRHTVSDDFYHAPGEQDLTAHVNFSALIDAGREAGLALTGYATQERFLMALGEENQFADLEDPNQSAAERLDARLKLKRLINPEGMGNIFKVLVQQRGVAGPKLTGLKFAQ